jgi:putative redox protein
MGITVQQRRTPLRANEPVRSPERGPGDHRLTVTHVTGDTYAVEVRGHRVLVDQPLEAGGDDTAPTPTELFAASLATCVAFYAGRYLDRHGEDRTRLSVATEFTMADERPARIATIHVRIDPPAGLTEQRRAGLRAVAAHCTVNNTLHQMPGITFDLA